MLGQRYYLEVISQSGRALMDILNEILDLSRIEANKIELEEIEFNLGESLESIIRLFSGSADAKGLILNCRIPVHIPLDLVGDPIRLNQLVYINQHVNSYVRNRYLGTFKSLSFQHVFLRLTIIPKAEISIWKKFIP